MSKRNLENILAENMRRFGTKNLNERSYYGNYGNRRRNPAADEYRPQGQAVEPTPSEWDELIDQLNDDPRFTTHSSGDKQYVKNNETGKSFAIQWDTMDGYWRAPGADTKAEDVVAMARKEYGLSGGTGNGLTDDEMLDIIMSYAQDPDDAEMALQTYKETGEFNDAELEANVTRDPRWK